MCEASVVNCWREAGCRWGEIRSVWISNYWWCLAVPDSHGWISPRLSLHSLCQLWKALRWISPHLFWWVIFLRINGWIYSYLQSKYVCWNKFNIYLIFTEFVLCHLPAYTVNFIGQRNHLFPYCGWQLESRISALAASDHKRSRYICFSP